MNLSATRKKAGAGIATLALAGGAIAGYSVAGGDSSGSGSGNRAAQAQTLSDPVASKSTEGQGKVGKLDDVRTMSGQRYGCKLHRVGNRWYAGWYNGNTVVPSSRGVTRAGIEAQCILEARVGVPSPGPIDGIFGPKSRASMRWLQSYANRHCNARLRVDGIPGPRTWPWLRHHYGSGC